MGCFLCKPSKNESQPSNGGRRREPPHEIGFRFSGSSETKLLLAARTSDFHGFTNLGTPILCQRVLGNWKGWNLEAKAKASGASQLVSKDLKEEFVPDFIGPFGLPMRV